MIDNEILFVHKYQPMYFADFGENNDVVNLLKTLITFDSLNVLLAGDIAAGKTSLLNSLIREYYVGTTPKEYADNVLYINSLKEQGINYYRTEVKTFCQTCSVVKHKKKIIVLDDIDIINEQSQQVFRNFMDKYSHNVHFVASCSNIQKVIESLQSRFTIVKMKPLTKEGLVSIINHIKQSENILIDDDAQEFIINVSNNIVKTLVTYMEKFKLLNERITIDLAVQLCSNISFSMFADYIALVLSHNLPDSIKLIYEIHDKGYSVMDILDNFFFFVKTTSIINEDHKYVIIPCICKYITIFHEIHEDELELALFTNNLIELLKVLPLQIV